jgi:predicted ATPase
VGRHGSPPADPPASIGSDVWAGDPARLCIEAETCFRQALEIAHEQPAKSLELRAAMSLSRLWQQQGNTNAARERLEESYHWFTEGFDPADLRKAMALRGALE